MKLLIFASLAAVALASPQFRGFQRASPPRSDLKHIAILSDNRYDQGDGNFGYDFETEHGIKVEAQGTPGSKGQSNIGGFYRFVLDDGTTAEVRYVADELGYRAESPLVPTPTPSQNTPSSRSDSPNHRAAGLPQQKVLMSAFLLTLTTGHPHASVQ